MGKSPAKDTSERDPKETERIRDEALKRAMGVGSKPKTKDEKSK